MTTDFAIAAIKGENLGQDYDTDFLTISYSSTDYIGHNFGVNSKEVQDTYIRLDRNIADLLDFLDKEVGNDNYILFLTADHAGVDVSSYLKSLNIPAGHFNTREMRSHVQAFTEKEYGEKGLIENVSNDQIFFDYKLMNQLDIDPQELQDKVADLLIQYEHIHRVYTRNQIIKGAYTEGADALIKNGFHHKRSGDVLYILEPSYVSSSRTTGSSHGSGYSYDTHVPLLFYGKGVKSGSTSRRSEIVDIAPTLATMLGISHPSATTGKPLNWMMKE